MASHVLDPDLRLFQYHLPGRGVVPGALLMTIYVTGRHPTGPVAALTSVRFHEFVRAGERFHYERATDDTVRALVGDRLCCTFVADIDVPMSALSARPPDPDRDVLVPGSPVAGQPVPGQPVRPLRAPEYWFLPPVIGLDRPAGMARTEIDLTAIAADQAYLREVPDWPMLVMIEAAGNLALAIQDRGEDAAYVFARFGSLTYHVDAAQVSRVAVETRVRRAGSILVWDATVRSGGSTVLEIGEGVSAVARAGSGMQREEDG